MWSTNKNECLRCFCVCMCVPSMCNFYQLPFLVLYVDATGFLQKRSGRKTGFSLSEGLSKLLDETSHGSSEVSTLYGFIFSTFWSFEKDVS